MAKLIVLNNHLTKLERVPRFAAEALVLGVAPFAPHLAEPGSLYIESRVEGDVLDRLRDRGHQVVEAGPWSLGRICAVGRDPQHGMLSAAANPRGGQGYAAGR